MKKNIGSMPKIHKTLRLEIDGFNQSRIINALNAQNIVLRNLRRLSPKLLSLDINKKDAQKTFAILAKMCYNYSIVGESGSKVLFARCLTHIGLVVGLLVFAALGAFSNSFVWRVEIEGNESVETALIVRSLKENGIKTGVSKHKLDGDSIASLLRDIDGIAEGTAEIRGTTLRITVIEQKVHIPPDEPQYPSDLVSGFDAEITRVIAEKGTAAVKVGDRVARGEPLIKGEILDTNGLVMDTCSAKGRVYGKTSFNITEIFSATEFVKERTGRKKTFTSLRLLGIGIGKTNPAFEGWEKVVSREKMFFIPVLVTRTTLFETRLVERERDIDAHVESLKSKALLDNVIRAGGSEIETVTTLTETEVGLYMLNIHLVAEVLLAEN